MKFYDGRHAVRWAWHGQFDCLVCSNPWDRDSIGGGAVNGNISAGLAQAMDIKRWLERYARKVGIGSIDLILLSELPQPYPITLLPWQQTRVDKAMKMLEDQLEELGWIEETCCILLRDGV